MAQLIRRGVGCLSDLVELIAESGCRRILVIHGRSSFKSSGAKNVFDSLSGLEISYFGSISPNPEISTVGECFSLFSEFMPDTVFAIGGGSVIDTAKIVFALSSGGTEAEILSSQFNLNGTRPRFWVAPTTAGSGSESTHFAVLYRHGKKYSIANQKIKPDEVFLDPELTLSCPKYLTLASGSDAVCQAIESFWSRNSTDESRNLSLKALPSLLRNIFTSVDFPDDLEARSSMLYSANLVGQAIDIAKTTAGHAMSYGLTSHFGISHGIAVLLVMRPLVRLMDQDYKYFSKRCELDTAFSSLGSSFAEAFASFFIEVWTRIGKKVRKTIEIVEGENVLNSLCSKVNAERLSNHPINLSASNIAFVYDQVLELLK